MKKYSLMFALCASICYVQAQVGIGTTTPDDGSILQIDSKVGAFVPPRMTSTEMAAISSPLDGALVYNTTLNSYCIFSNGTWSSQSNSTLIINKDYPSTNSALSAPDNTYVDFPIGPADVLVTNPDVYDVTANGTVIIKESGNYLFSASLSTPNMPSGSKKYIIALEVNNSLVAYLSRGFSSLPNQDYWGTSGNVMYPINANDVITMKYVLNNGDVALNAKFVNIGISHLN
ncbi:hypothetical protein ACFFU1_14030 [Algibacter miyuki]|uniref:C1q domain-containing protein n=1 Tax=Algibacter miyuki TaxID=1306933 RepID=A0ABV5H2A1_9FLAO|nr:hypothetical protein [Algibacter miyuki]MDN3664427.1 hypothetical protein [Algibacter miyuki]